jgi:ribosomal protein RSM22 (predicted rRNA methylase)
MPATYAAVRAALDALRARTGDWAPATHLDLGGGTGAATWAVAATWQSGPGGTAEPTAADRSDSSGSPAGPGSAVPAARPGHTSTVLDWSTPALELGRRLARSAEAPAVREARWTRAPLGGAAELPSADLVTVSYLIGELAPADRTALLDAAAAATRGALVVAEPGTPDGYARIIDARDQLTNAGLTVVAPCPHGAACPITGTDWCHFAARVPRTSLHRQIKGGTLPYEDEKFSYVAAVRPAAVPATPAPNRVVRHPLIRKGQVLLDLCAADGTLTRAHITKRHGPAYRAARDTEWGDSFSAAPSPEGA